MSNHRENGDDFESFAPLFWRRAAHRQRTWPIIMNPE